MKRLVQVAILALTFGFASTSTAGVCGRGTIVDLKVGGWNTDNIYIKLQGPNSDGAHPGTRKSGANGDMFVVYNANQLSDLRIESILRVASLAFAMGTEVWTYSHSSNCQSTTELSILQ